MVSPIDRLLDAVDWRGGQPPCDCWERRKANALAYIAHLAERCGCTAPGGHHEPCGCSPVCEGHTIDEGTAAARGAALDADAGKERAG